VLVSQTRLAEELVSDNNNNNNHNHKARKLHGTHVSPSVEQLTTKVPSLEKSIPVTGSL